MRADFSTFLSPPLYWQHLFHNGPPHQRSSALTRQLNPWTSRYRPKLRQMALRLQKSVHFPQALAMASKLYTLQIKSVSADLLSRAISTQRNPSRLPRPANAYPSLAPATLFARMTADIAGATGNKYRVIVSPYRRNFLGLNQPLTLKQPQCAVSRKTLESPR